MCVNPIFHTRIFISAFAIVLLILSLITSERLVTDRSKELISPPLAVKNFTFGYNESSADILWIRSIQDFDYCEKQIAFNTCHNNSWLFNMLDLVTELSPFFRVPYSAGGLALTILITDIDGATKIFEKGVKNLPKDWTISYRAAYHYLYELKNKERAAELLIQAGENGAPPWVFTLAGRLYSDSGELDLARQVLREMRETNQDAAFIKRLEEKIATMEAEQAAKK